jgi:hypothetical protein
MDIEELVEIEAIKQLKYRYIRAVDTRDGELLASTLAEEATASYRGGSEASNRGTKVVLEGRDVIVGYVMRLQPGVVLSAHRVHQPEIELTGPDRATARWAMDDTVISLDVDETLRGAAYYDDVLVKRDGQWLILHTGFRRLYAETSGRDGITLFDHWWAENPT